MYFANARSIRNKSIAVALLLNAIDYDIVCFVETYLTTEDTSAKYLAGCGDVYDLFRCDRTSRAGGGVAVYSKRCLNPVRLAVPIPSVMLKQCVSTLKLITVPVFYVYTDHHTVTVFIATTYVS